MRAPLIGPPRQPRTVRVCGAELADEVRRVLPGARVVDAPTPELQQVVDQMEESLPASDDDEDASYLEGGRIDPDTMHELFVAAKLLFEAAPWKVASDSQIIRVDIPAHGIEAGCISIIGAMEESLGFILFPSLRGYERFLGAADRPRRPGQPFDLGTTMLALDFEVGSALPASLRREVMKHGWPVAAANAYPVIHHRSRDAALMPTSEREVRTITANDPCPCGSGKKFKRCCLNGAGAAGHRDHESNPDHGRPRDHGAITNHGDHPPASIHELDKLLVERIAQFARRRFGREWVAPMRGCSGIRPRRRNSWASGFSITTASRASRSRTGSGRRRGPASPPRNSHCSARSTAPGSRPGRCSRSNLERRYS
ncbi:MAG: SEC-C domain-containing protein [Candidatus Eisenbacteria bacterium]|nr:SEC-C domain-containing protein [Candidatus Eisenbacteria bacterium]